MLECRCYIAADICENVQAYMLTFTFGLHFLSLAN
jgi:hypothetical protein